MDRARYLELLDVEGQRLRQSAEGNLAAAVPPCPGWTVADAVAHTAEVYENKIACIELAGARPDPWPPAWPDDRDPVAWFADAHGRLLHILRTTDPGAASWTWWPPDQTAGFWIRRMAQETAVHRADVQSASGAVTPVDSDLAQDGVDEVLIMMLAGDWSDAVQPGSTGTVAVTVRDTTWRILLRPDTVHVDQEGGDSDAQLTGAPSDVLLWLWGRRPDSAVDITGDQATAARLRQRLMLATQ
jgi:uncharacterized protein (TIGR03083 family)